jgi:hypothetical protein
LHAQVQEFVQNKLATMLRTTFKKKKDLARWGPLLSWNSTVVYFI